jgi:hypothetical protein
MVGKVGQRDDWSTVGPALVSFTFLIPARIFRIDDTSLGRENGLFRSHYLPFTSLVTTIPN